MREPKSVMVGIQQRGQWGIIRDRRDEWELEVEIEEDAVVYGSEHSSLSWEVCALNLLKRATLLSWR